MKNFSDISHFSVYDNMSQEEINRILDAWIASDKINEELIVERSFWSWLKWKFKKFWQWLNDKDFNHIHNWESDNNSKDRYIPAEDIEELIDNNDALQKQFPRTSLVIKDIDGLDDVGSLTIFNEDNAIAAIMMIKTISPNSKSEQIYKDLKPILGNLSEKDFIKIWNNDVLKVINSYNKKVDKINYIISIEFAKSNKNKLIITNECLKNVFENYNEENHVMLLFNKFSIIKDQASFLTESELNWFKKKNYKEIVANDNTAFIIYDPNDALSDSKYEIDVTSTASLSKRIKTSEEEDKKQKEEEKQKKEENKTETEQNSEESSTQEFSDIIKNIKVETLTDSKSSLDFFKKNSSKFPLFGSLNNVNLEDNIFLKITYMPKDANPYMIAVLSVFKVYKPVYDYFTSYSKNESYTSLSKYINIILEDDSPRYDMIIVNKIEFNSKLDWSDDSYTSFLPFIKKQLINNDDINWVSSNDPKIIFRYNHRESTKKFFEANNISNISKNEEKQYVYYTDKDEANMKTSVKTKNNKLKIKKTNESLSNYVKESLDNNLFFLLDTWFQHNEEERSSFLELVDNCMGKKAATVEDIKKLTNDLNFDIRPFVNFINQEVNVENKNMDYHYCLKKIIDAIIANKSTSNKYAKFT